jgi:hypothetical protein
MAYMAGANIFIEEIRQRADQAAIQVLFGDPKIFLGRKNV